MTDLCILDLQSPWRENEGDKRGGEEHLEEGNVAFSCVEAFCERVGGEYAEAPRGADREMAVVLVEGDEIHGHRRCERRPAPEILQRLILRSRGRQRVRHRRIAGRCPFGSLSRLRCDLPRLAVVFWFCMWSSGHFLKRPSPVSGCDLIPPAWDGPNPSGLAARTCGWRLTHDVLHLLAATHSF
jgi:hypothetical protein